MSVYTFATLLDIQLSFNRQSLYDMDMSTRHRLTRGPSGGRRSDSLWPQFGWRRGRPRRTGSVEDEAAPASATWHKNGPEMAAVHEDNEKMMQDHENA